MVPKFIISSEPYDIRMLIGGSVVVSARQYASKALLGLLKNKAGRKAKKTTRFFGEAYIANTTRHREGHYGSFKWLTNVRFLGEQPFSAAPSRGSRQALHKHFGVTRLRRLQQTVRQLHRARHKVLNDKLPTAPDLWLVDRPGKA